MFGMSNCSSVVCQKNTAQAKENTNFEAFILSDLHFVSPKNISNPKQYICDKGILSFSSGAIIKTALDKAILTKHKNVLVCGDLCDNSLECNHKELSKIFHQYSNKGLNIYVVPGNHDLLGIYSEKNAKRLSNKKFREFYNDFGYSKAQKNVFGLSYATNIGNVRLIALDNISFENKNYDKQVENLEKLIKFSNKQAEIAKKQNKIPIVMMHKPLSDIMGKKLSKILNLADESFLQHRVISGNKKFVLSNFAKTGVRYIFSGHIHASNIDKLKTDDGKTIVSVTTSSLIDNSPSFRAVKISQKGIDCKTKTIDFVNPDYIPKNAPKETKEKLHFGLKKIQQADQKRCVLNQIYKELNKFLKNSTNSFFGDKKVSQDKQKLFDMLLGLANKNLYGKDSIDEILMKYGGKLPKSNYKTMIDAIYETTATFMDGKRFEKNSVELDLFFDFAKVFIIKSIENNNFFALDKTRFVQMKNSEIDCLCRGIVKNGKIQIVSNDILNNLLNIQALEDFRKNDKLMGAFVPKRINTIKDFSTFIDLIEVGSGLIDLQNPKDYFVVKKENGKAVYTGEIDMEKIYKKFVLSELLSDVIFEQNLPNIDLKYNFSK